MDEREKEKDEATEKVIQLLEEWGADSKFIWFREIHRITDIDKGLLRNILNELKKSRDVKEVPGDTRRIFLCLKKYYKKCLDLQKRFKGKPIMAKDGSKVRIFQNTTKSSERTRKRLEKQKQKRQVRTFAKSKSRAKLKNRTRPHKS